MNADASCVAITCGPGYEPVDAVRRLTNFSTGSLGAALARRFRETGWRVLLFRAEMSTAPAPDGVELIPFGTGAELLERLRETARRCPVRAVLHAAALSDFRVRMAEASAGEALHAGSGKIPTSLGVLTLRLEPAPKVLPELRGLFPHAFIAGWKYEVEGGRASAIKKAADQLASCRTDVCVVNGPAFGPGFGVLDSSGCLLDAPDAGALFEILRTRIAPLS